MTIKEIHIRRCVSGGFSVEISLSMPDDRLCTASALLKKSLADVCLDPAFQQAVRYTHQIRKNLRDDVSPLSNLPKNVYFTDALGLTVADVRRTLSSVMRFARPSAAFSKEVLSAVYRHFDETWGGGKDV